MGGWVIGKGFVEGSWLVVGKIGGGGGGAGERVFRGGSFLIR